MPSLEECLKIAGAAISDSEKERIRQSAYGYRRQGLAAIDAPIEAVNSLLRDVAEEKTYVQRQVDAFRSARPDIGTLESIDVPKLSDVLAGDIRSNTSPKNKVELENRVASMLGTTRQALMKNPAWSYKSVEEAYEYAVVKLARDIIAEGATLEETFKKLKSLYDAQPLLATRTSESIRQQAYSTPVDLAFLMQEMAGISENTSVYEPTAGTGMLVTKANPSRVTANEVQESRTKILEDQGIKTVSRGNAEQAGVVESDSQDVMIANPPFGTSSKPVAFNGYKLDKRDHIIVARALAGMKPNGRAVFLIGGSNFKDGKMTDSNRIFLNWLYRHYNVAYNIDIPGDLYARQGASYPVRLLVVEGRKTTPEGYAPTDPSHSAYTSVKSIDEIVKIAKEIKDAKAKPGRKPEVSVPAAGAPTVPGPETGAGGRVPGEATEEGGPRGGVPTVGDTGARQGGERPPGGRRPITPAAPVREPKPEEPTKPAEQLPGAGGVAKPGRPVPPVSPEGAGPEGTAGRPGGRPGTEGQGRGKRGVPEGAEQPKPGGVVGTRDITSEVRDITEDDIDDIFAEAAKEMEGDVIASPPAPNVSESAPKLARIPFKVPSEVARQSRATFMGWFNERARQRRPKSIKVKKELPPPLTPKTALKKSAQSAKKAMNEALNGLDALFGDPNTLRSGITFDEETYAKAKPHFEAAWKYAVDAGYNLKEFARLVFQRWGTRVQPYIKRFVMDKQRELIDKERPPAKETDFQTNYVPKSKVPLLEDTLIPRKMAQAVQRALDRIESEVGDIDEYVRTKLQYDKMDPSILAGDQVDAVAMSIYNIDRGAGMIIGDQTGVGKGRVAAALFRYAILNGKTPIFFTEKANLFSDFYRDLKGVKNEKINPFIVASDEQKARVVNEDGDTVFNVLKPEEKRRAYSRMINNGTQALTDDGYDCVFCTYSQINQANTQQRVLNRLAQNTFIVLDEAHNASGQSTTMGFISDLIRTNDVLYMSATFAKRPDNMPLYYRTDMSRANMSINDMIKAIQSGGAPLQESVSTDLTSLGQLIRREKSFDGITMDSHFDTKNTKRDEKRSDAATKILRSIVDFSYQVQRMIDSMSGDDDVFGVPIPGSVIIGDKRVTASVEGSNFAAVVHNAVRQLLLCLKADMAVKMAVEELEAGRKPIIGISHTLGSFVIDQIKAGMLKRGDRFDLNFSNVLERHLRRSLSFKVKGPTDRKWVQHDIPIEDCPPHIQKQYNEIRNEIQQFSGDITGNPIDYMRQQLMKRGYKVAEITGRQFVADLENLDKPIMSVRKDRSKINDRIREFNNGGVDVLIINSSGATGLSAHAAPEFKDKRPRVYIGIQAELNVDTEVQKMGRINRKGQVTLPRYRFGYMNIPAEIRPAAVLQKKLKSLSANTSANQDSPLAQREFPDMFNRYGDNIVINYLMNEPDLAHMLGIDPEAAISAGILMKATGRIAIQPVSMQRDFYDEIEQEYNYQIEQMKQEGTFDLEREDLDFRASTIDRELMVSGRDESNPFGRSTFMEKLNTRLLRKPYKAERIAELIQDKPRDMLEKIFDSVSNALEEYIDSKRNVALENEQDFSEREAELRHGLTSLSIWFGDMKIGDTYNIEGANVPDNTKGVLIDVKHVKGAGNPAAPSRIQFVFAVNNGFQRMTYALSRFTEGAEEKRVSVDKYSDGISKRWDSLLPTMAMVPRYIITGNMLQGYSGAPDGSRIVRFSMDDGTWRQGILMPARFRPERARVTVTPEQAVRIVQAGSPLNSSSVTVSVQNNGIWVAVPTSRAKGGVYYLDDNLNSLTQRGEFESRGGKMRGFFPNDNIGAAINRLYELGTAFDVDANIYRQVIGSTSVTSMPVSDADTNVSDASVTEAQQRLVQNIKHAAIYKQQFAAEYVHKAARQILGKWGDSIIVNLKEFITVSADEIAAASIAEWEAMSGKKLEGEIRLRGRARTIKTDYGKTMTRLSQVIELSYGYATEDVKTAAFHEVFHHVWNMLDIPQSLRDQILFKFGDNLETMAETFGKWARAKADEQEAIMDSLDNDSAVKKFFTRLRNFLRKIFNHLTNYGYVSADEFFGDIWDKNFNFITDERIYERARMRDKVAAAVEAGNVQYVNKIMDGFIEASVDPTVTSEPVRQEIAQSVEEDPLNPYNINESYSKATIATFLKPFITNGKLNLQKIAEKTDINLSSNNPKDILKATRLIQTMQDFARNFPAARELLDTEIEGGSVSHQLNMQDRDTTAPYFDLLKSDKKNPAAKIKDLQKKKKILDRVNKALIYGDKINRYLNRTDLVKRFGLTEEGMKAYWSIRKVLDNKLTMILRQMIGGIVTRRLAPPIGAPAGAPRKMPDIDIEAAIKAIKERNNNLSRKTATRRVLTNQLKVALEELGFDEAEIEKIAGGGGVADWAMKRRAYVPHTWKTEWVVKVRTKDDQEYMFEVPSVKGRIMPTRQQREDAAFKDAMKVAVGKLGAGNLQDVRLIHSRHIPVELFDKTSVATMNSIIESASELVANEFGASGVEREYVDEIKGRIQKYMEQLYLAKGWGRHLIPRKGTPGFRTDLEKVIPEYLINFNAYTAKGQKALKFARTMRKIDARKTPNLWSMSKEYISDMLGEKGNDAVAFKRLVGLYFLAGDVSAATLNATQNWTHAVAILRKVGGKHTAEQYISRAMYDVVREYVAARKTGRGRFTVSNKFIKASEIKAMREAYERGILDPQYFGEVTGMYGNKFYQTYLEDTYQLLFKMFTGTEAWNRMSTFLAAYRKASDAKHPDPVKFAGDAVNTAHFIYGHGNRPELIRKAGWIGSMAYTFMTYPVNNIVFLKHRIQDRLGAETKDEKRAANRVIMSNLAYIMAFGGLEALPFAFLAKWLWKMIDDDPEDDLEKWLHTGTNKHIARVVVRGIPSVFGNDMSWRMEGTDIAGAPIGFQTAQTIYRRAISRGWVPMQRGDYWQGLFMMMPDFAMNPYRAFFADQGTGIEGLPPIKYTPGESAWKALGFTPTRESETWKAQGMAWEKKANRLSKLQHFADWYTKYVERKDMKGMAKLRNKVLKYNADERAKGTLGVPIDWEEVRKSAKRRGEARGKEYGERLPKYMKRYQKSVKQSFGLD